jgi:hypothetical protein
MVKNVLRLEQEVWSKGDTIRHPLIERARRQASMPTRRKLGQLTGPTRDSRRALAF